MAEALPPVGKGVMVYINVNGSLNFKKKISIFQNYFLRVVCPESFDVEFDDYCGSYFCLLAFWLPTGFNAFEAWI